MIHAWFVGQGSRRSTRRVLLTVLSYISGREFSIRLFSPYAASFPSLHRLAGTLYGTENPGWRLLPKGCLAPFVSSAQAQAKRYPL